MLLLGGVEGAGQKTSPGKGTTRGLRTSSSLLCVNGAFSHCTLLRVDPLTPTQRRELRAKAHHLEPVVIVGHHGVTPPVLHEIDVALLAHDLVKVRVLGDDREARQAMLGAICQSLDCAAVQHVGKVLVVWRPNPERKQKAKALPAEAPITRKKKTGPRAAPDPVRERRRAQPGEASVAQRRSQPKGAPPASPRRIPPEGASAAASPRRAPRKEPAATSRRRTRG